MCNIVVYSIVFTVTNEHRVTIIWIPVGSKCLRQTVHQVILQYILMNIPIRINPFIIFIEECIRSLISIYSLCVKLSWITLCCVSRYIILSILLKNPHYIVIFLRYLSTAIMTNSYVDMFIKTKNVLTIRESIYNYLFYLTSNVINISSRKKLNKVTKSISFINFGRFVT